MTWLAKTWGWLKRAVAWLGDNLWALFAVIAAVLAAVLGWRTYRKKVGSLKDAVKVERARNKVSALEAKRKVVEERADVKREEIEGIDRKILDNKKAVVEAHKRTEAMDAAQVENEFRRLGY